ncbi:MAG: hypothetical protein ACD_39C01517G0001, partial [uncultured bacterium]
MQESVSVFDLARTGNQTLEKILNENPEQLDAREIKLGETPLHFAAAGGHTATVKLLLSKGADINSTNDFLRTPLHYAAIMGHFDVVKVLCA